MFQLLQMTFAIKVSYAFPATNFLATCPKLYYVGLCARYITREAEYYMLIYNEIYQANVIHNLRRQRHIIHFQMYSHMILISIIMEQDDWISCGSDTFCCQTYAIIVNKFFL